MIFIALSPILWLIVALTVMHMSAWKACSIALLVAWAASFGIYGMTPLHAAGGYARGRGTRLLAHPARHHRRHLHL